MLFPWVMSESADDAWTIPIRIGMWTIYSVALILVMVVVMMNA